MPTPNLMQRLNAVMKKVAFVNRDKVVGDGRYAYEVATYDEVVSKVREHLVEAGVMVMTRQIGTGRMVGTGTFFGGREGKAPIEAMRYEGVYEIDFINCDSPDDKYTVTIETHAIDQGDKAPGKAQTYATKAAIKKALLLESGDEEEERARVEPTKPSSKPAAKSDAKPETKPETKTEGRPKPDSDGKKIAAGQVAFLRRKLAEKKKEESGLLAHLGVQTLESVTEPQFALAQAWLRQ